MIEKKLPCNDCQVLLVGYIKENKKRIVTTGYYDKDTKIFDDGIVVGPNIKFLYWSSLPIFPEEKVKWYKIF